MEQEGEENNFIIRMRGVPYQGTEVSAVLVSMHPSHPSSPVGVYVGGVDCKISART